MEKLAHNYHALRGLTPYGTKFMGLVKADGYGHGAVPMAKKLEELGADYLGVASLDEAIELREAGLNIDWFPTNFIGREGTLYYVDYECNPYMDQWSFENWGVRYWSRTPELDAYAKEHGDS